MKWIFFFLALSACAQAKTVNKDVGMSAIAAGDFTALIEGCGHGMIPGYTYCRKTEGDAANDKLYFIGPVTNCKKDFCVEFKIYGPDGEVVYGNSIPKKKSRAEVPWNKLLKRDTFEINDRGFWLYTYRVYWNDENGNENVSVSEGEIRMRVIRKEYVDLHEVISDRNFVPQWEIYTRNNETIKITSGMRTSVSKNKETP